MSDFSMFASTLKESLECPVCLKVPQQKPIYQCDNGHIICKICHAQLTTCPQCRRPLGTSRSLVAERFLEAFPEPCKYSKQGCNVKVVLYQAEEHFKECLFREAECPIDTCGKKIILSKLKSHIQNDHRHGYDKFVSSHPGKYISGNIGMHPYSGWSPDQITFNDHLFFHMLKQGPENSRFLWVYGLGSEKDMSKFSFTLRLYHPEVANQIVFKGQVVSIDCPKAEVIASKQCIFLAEESLRWVAKNDGIKYDVEIFKK